MGTMTAPLTYLIGRRLFGRVVGVVAAVGLAFSFWSLMYSRVGIRHISVLVFTLPALYCAWMGLVRRENAVRTHTWLIYFGLAGLFLGINFYTYFAARGVPLILLAFFLYLVLFYRPVIRRTWPGWLLMGGVMAVTAVPLIVTLSTQPESEARVAELAVPLVEARAGNFEPLGEHVQRTLNMFHSDGDDEWLYNIPYRPVFGPVAAVFFWVGVVIAVWKSVLDITRRLRREEVKGGKGEVFDGGNKMASCFTGGGAAYPFLLLWWLAGITPGFISVPAASLGHTLVAQPAVYLLAALPVKAALAAYRWRSRGEQPTTWLSKAAGNRWVVVGLALLLLGSNAWRDTADYFGEWANRGMTRFLYRADVKNLTEYLEANPELTDFGATSLLAGPWDQEAFKIDLDRENVARPRWYNPERALLLALGGQRPLSFSGYPVVPVLHPEWYEDIAGETAGGYQLAEINSGLAWDTAQEVCFQNGLCWLGAGYNQAARTLEMIWWVKQPLDLPDNPLISNPPPPGVYAGPRLLVFGQALDDQGNFLAGDDGLWVDIYSLYPGDVFLQQHRLAVPGGQYPAVLLIGLYDPMTGQRILTEDGRDHLRITCPC
jgi:hypothetical protein